MRSSYSITTVPGFICLTDLNQGKSVTNDAEDVIVDLMRAGHDLCANRVLYRDSDGIWDELVVHQGHFDGFHCLRAKDLDTAIATADERGRP